MKKSPFVFFALLLTLSCISCKKDKEYDMHPNLNVADDVILLHRPFLYVTQMLVKAVVDSTLKAAHHTIIDSALVTFDPTNNKYIFEFTGKLCLDSVVRNGSFTAQVDTNFFNQGAVTKIIYHQYFEDIHLITGNDSMVCTGLQNGSYQFDRFITDAVVSKDSLHAIQWMAKLHFSVTESVVTHGLSNSVMLFTGSSSGFSSGGYTFSTEITRSLAVWNCPWIRDGLISVEIPDLPFSNGTIEFMAGTLCNSAIKYDFEGNLFLLWMKEKFLKY
ncbi:MAG: hypothetical protein M0P47_08565 [Bacteroidales bacterium]|nr:hypothetical protein [Bacteroidales bacterium]